MLPFRLAPPITKGGGKAVPCVSYRSEIGSAFVPGLIQSIVSAVACSLLALILDWG